MYNYVLIKIKIDVYLILLFENVLEISNFEKNVSKN